MILFIIMRGSCETHVVEMYVDVLVFIFPNININSKYSSNKYIDI